MPGMANQPASRCDGKIAPLCRVVRQAGDLTGPTALQDLYELWSASRRDGALPGRSEIDVFSLRPWLGYLNLVEPTEEDDGFRYRLFGSEIAGTLLCEMTASRVEDLPTSYAGFIVESYRLAQRERRPVFTCHDADQQARPYRWYRLILPLAAPRGDGALQFLTAAYPEFGVGEPMEGACEDPPPSS